MPRDSNGEWTRKGFVPCSSPLTETGAVRLPRELLEFLTWREGDLLTAELSGDDRGLVLYRSRDLCAHCGSGAGLIRVRREGRDTGTCICRDCLEEARIAGFPHRPTGGPR